MSSKLDYLSKYTDNGKGLKKKKKKKKRKKTDVSDWNDLPPVAQASDEEEDNASDGPVVVETEPFNTIAKTSKGTWESVGSQIDGVGDPQHKRRRFDSDSDSDKCGRRKRYDSSEQSSGDDARGSRNTPKRYDSDGDHSDRAPAKNGRRQRYDSADEQSEASSRGKRKRYDSDSDEDCSSGRRRYDSESSEDKQPDFHKSGKTKDYQPGSDVAAERMTSGHHAGLQSGSSFQKAEADIQKARKAEAQALVDKHGVPGDTVYRKSASTSKRELTETEQALLNTGSVQKQQAVERIEEMERLKNSSFARHADDDRLEESLKSTLREGDPMLQYATSKKKPKKSKKSRGGAKDSIPVYKGPPAKPNRFGIKPGFRWDGVDRGNGWEDKLLAKAFSRQYKAEQAHKWSTADM